MITKDITGVPLVVAVQAITGTGSHSTASTTGTSSGVGSQAPDVDNFTGQRQKTYQMSVPKNHGKWCRFKDNFRLAKEPNLKSMAKNTIITDNKNKINVLEKTSTKGVKNSFHASAVVHKQHGNWCRFKNSRFIKTITSCCSKKDSNGKKTDGKKSDLKISETKETELKISEKNESVTKSTESKCIISCFSKKDSNDQKSDGKISELKIFEPKISEPTICVPRISETMGTETMISETMISKTKGTDLMISEKNESEIKSSELKIFEPKIFDTKASEPEIYEPNISKTKETETKISENNEPEIKVSQTKISEPEVCEPKISDVKISVNKKTQAKKTESKESETKKSEIKSSQTKISEPKISVNKETEANESETITSVKKKSQTKISQSKTLTKPKNGLTFTVSRVKTNSKTTQNSNQSAIVKGLDKRVNKDMYPMIRKLSSVFVTNDIVLGQYLGGGSNGIALAAKMKGKDVVVKLDTNGSCDMSVVVDRMSQLNHKNIMKVYKLQVNPSNMMVMDIGQYDLFKLLKNRGKPLTYEQTQKISKNIIDGVLYLHSNGWAHTDLKCGNIVISNTENNRILAKIIDFDSIVSIFSDKDKSVLVEGRAKVFTPNYSSPEIHMKSIIKDMRKPDVYAIGVTIHVMVTNRYPHPNIYDYKSVNDMKAKVKYQFDAYNSGHMFAKIPVNNQTEGLIRVLKRFLNPYFDKRESLDVISEDNYFKYKIKQDQKSEVRNVGT